MDKHNKVFNGHGHIEKHDLYVLHVQNTTPHISPREAQLILVCFNFDCRTEMRSDGFFYAADLLQMSPPGFGQPVHCSA